MSCAPNLGRKYSPGTFRAPARSVHTVFLHCTATSNRAVDAEDVNRWHKDRGWDCIGYHFLIKTDGTVQYGRSLERTPSAQQGNNTGTIAICLNGLERSDFTEAQYISLRTLANDIDAAYGKKLRFRGHTEVSAKSCPVFDYRKVLGLDSSGYMTDAVPVPPAQSIPLVPVTLMLAQLGEGDEHEQVAWVRGLLRLPGHDTKFDPLLEQAVRGFQHENGLVADGIVGKSTWPILFDVGG